MQIPRKYIDGYTETINAVRDGALAQMLPALERIDYESPYARDLVKAVFAEAMPEYAEASAYVAAQFYDGLREMQLGEALGAEVITGGSMTQTDIAIDGIFDQAKTADGVYQGLRQRIGYEVARAAGECVYQNGLKDSKDVRYARVPSGSETCKWCLMLASRGFVYRSKKNAGELNHYHSHCDCRVVPGFAGDTTVEGYDTKRLYDMWKNGDNGNQSDMLKQYTDGNYMSVSAYTQLKYGGRGKWELNRAIAYDKAEDVATDAEARFSDALYQRIVNSSEKKMTLVRTERESSGMTASIGGQGKSARYDSLPEIGETLRFGVKSSSYEKGWAEKIAREEVEGMGDGYSIRDTERKITAFRIKDATRYADISDVSDFDQKEALIAGSYRVDGISIERVTVEDKTKPKIEKKITIEQYAKDSGQELEFFTSKKGNEMVRVGTRTYPIDYMGKEIISTGEMAYETYEVEIRYIDLTEI